MSQKSDKEFEVIVKGKKKDVKLPIVAKEVEEAEEIAAPIIQRRRLGPIIETKEKPKKP
ncbi:MAG TPA: hypothetical protein VIC84_23115 [Blastocatellia bacterium]|jgi:hypothetical protein